MSYLDRTYVIFDGIVDRWARLRTMEWKSTARQNFNFYQAQDLVPRIDRDSQEVIKAQLWERLNEAMQVLVLLGENTRNCRFALWELDMAMTLRLPMVVANLNGLRELDPIRCPAILRDWPALHVEFSPRVVQAALDCFPAEFAKLNAAATGARRYSAEVYVHLAPKPPLWTRAKHSRGRSLTKWMFASR